MNTVVYLPGSDRRPFPRHAGGLPGTVAILSLRRRKPARVVDENSVSAIVLRSYYRLLKMHEQERGS